jgi:lipoprotein-anchoring transpeptidase ErfK/SrfK
MKLLRFVVVLAVLTSTALPAYAAKVVAQIDLSSQRMTVKVNGKTQYRWKVSTGRRGYSTPSGTSRPQRLERSWYSR